MRTLSLLAFLSLSLAGPLAAQAIVVPLRCGGACPAGPLPMDSVQVWANLDTEAVTYVDHVFRNTAADTVDAALFFPLPRDAEVHTVRVYIAQELTQYNEWSGPQESRWNLEGVARELPGMVPLAEYAETAVLHVPVLNIPPGATAQLQIAYQQPLGAEDGTIAYRYPLSFTATAAPAGHVSLGMEVQTEGGFRRIGSPSHAVRIELGTEPGPCPPRYRCGTRGYPSQRERVIRMTQGNDVRARDFVLRYTPLAPQAGRRVSFP